LNRRDLLKLLGIAPLAALPATAVAKPKPKPKPKPLKPPTSDHLLVHYPGGDVCCTAYKGDIEITESICEFSQRTQVVITITPALLVSTTENWLKLIREAGMEELRVDVRANGYFRTFKKFSWSFIGYSHPSAQLIIEGVC